MAQLDRERVTERLTLRRFTSGDLDVLADIYSRPEVARYLYWNVRSRDESAEALRVRVERTSELVDDNIMPIAVVWRSTNELIGDFMLRWSSDEHRQGEIGGSVHPDFQGRGVAGEVYRELLVMAFDELSLHRVVGRCDARNERSIRSLEKVGFVREAHFVENEWVKGEWTDEVIVAIRTSTRVRAKGGSR
jgi:RimJ/RimL family protein N-acetyltransferase